MKIGTKGIFLIKVFICVHVSTLLYFNIKQQLNQETTGEIDIKIKLLQ
jgi:hypothetical protein